MYLGDLTKQYEVPLSRMLHDILDDDRIQWHPTLIGHCTNFWPLLIWTLLPNLTFYLIVQGFHRTYATGAACQHRTLTPPDTWSCPTLWLACVLMSRPISPELVLSPDFWISNIPRYFSFACVNQVWNRPDLMRLFCTCHVVFGESDIMLEIEYDQNGTGRLSFNLLTQRSICGLIVQLSFEYEVGRLTNAKIQSYYTSEHPPFMI